MYIYSNSKGVSYRSTARPPETEPNNRP